MIQTRQSLGPTSPPQSRLAREPAEAEGVRLAQDRQAAPCRPNRLEPKDYPIRGYSTAGQAERSVSPRNPARQDLAMPAVGHRDNG